MGIWRHVRVEAFDGGSIRDRQEQQAGMQLKMNLTQQTLEDIVKEEKARVQHPKEVGRRFAKQTRSA